MNKYHTSTNNRTKHNIIIKERIECSNHNIKKMDTPGPLQRSLYSCVCVLVTGNISVDAKTVKFTDTGIMEKIHLRARRLDSSHISSQQDTSTSTLTQNSRIHTGCLTYSNNFRDIHKNTISKMRLLLYKNIFE